MSLLPPNITEEERNIVEAINYPVDPSIMRGFKFDPPDEFLAYLIWEYGLGELLRWLPDPRRAIREGVQWQRIRGTPASLKIALSWANLQGIFIEEEIPGEHFAEFQVGVGHDVPNDLFVDAVVELAKLSSPIRTRLTRMYNDRYDIRRFILDDSPWGNLLSDYSGCRLTPDGPVLSFGRYNGFYTSAPDWVLRGKHCPERYINAIIPDTYRLDQAVLGESDWHVLNHSSGYGRIYSVWNDTGVELDLEDIEPALRFAKAQVVLSDSWVLGDINSCFPVNKTEEEGRTTLLNDSKLSEEIWRLEYVPLNERFYDDHSAENASYDNLSAENVRFVEHVTRYNELIRWPTLSEGGYVAPAPIPRIDKSAFGFAEYGGMNDWHDFQHLDKPWTNTANIVAPTLDRWLYGMPEAFTDQQIHRGAGLSEYVLHALRNESTYQEDPLMVRDLFKESAYRGVDGWHGYEHQQRPWTNSDNIVARDINRFRMGISDMFSGQQVHVGTGLSEYILSALREDEVPVQHDPLMGHDHIGESQYRGVDGWHGHTHRHNPWSDASSLIAWVNNRQMLNGQPVAFTDQNIHDPIGESERFSEAMSETTFANTPYSERDFLGGESVYTFMEGWHGYQHLNTPWDASPAHIEAVHTQTMQ